MWLLYRPTLEPTIFEYVYWLVTIQAVLRPGAEVVRGCGHRDIPGVLNLTVIVLHG